MIAEVIDRASAEHYLWGEACDGWHLLKRDDLSIIAERVPPGAKEIRHFHSETRQFFFILSGSAVMEIEDRCVTLVEGQGLEVPPGARHQFRNESLADVHFLVISHPTTRGDRSEV
jgi:mannose-6-phosphate isomerase-like protein (cupin superfamily)